MNHQDFDTAFPAPNDADLPVWERSEFFPWEFCLGVDSDYEAINPQKQKSETFSNKEQSHDEK